MDDFIVSARKYRPADFDSVVGQETITNTLLKSIQNNHLAQAYLFCGPRGVGKTTCARILAKLVNEYGQPDVDENNDYAFNIFELDAASNNSVDDIRSLIDQVRIPPQVGKYKVYIIDEVHMLSTNAFNAFLKTLEEPPAYAIFILATTEKHKVLPTILSRCQIFDFNRIQITDMVNHLAKIAGKEGVEIGTDALHIIAEKADGGLRDALSIFDQVVGFSGNTVTYQDVISNLNILDYDYYFKMTDAFLRGDKPEVIILFNQILSNGFDGHNFINGLANHFRNLMFCTSERTVALLAVGEQVKAKYLAQSRECDLRFMLNAMNMLSEVDSRYKESKNQRLLVEITLLKLCSFSEKFNEKKNDNSEVAKLTDEQPRATAPETTSISPNVVAPESKPEPKEATPVPTSEEKMVSPVATELEPVVSQSSEQPIEIAEKNAEGVVEGKSDSSATAPAMATKDVEKPEESIPEKPKQETLKVEEPSKKSNGYSSKLAGLKSRGLPSLAEIGEEKKRKPRFEIDANQIEHGDDSSDFDNLPANEFTMAQLWKAWEKYAQIIKDKDQQSYFATLSKHNPILKEKFQIEFLVDNHVQFDDVERDKANLLEVVREELKNWKVQLRVVIDEEEGDDGDSLYDPYSKFEAMIKENPALGQLKEKLDLDIDYDG